MKVDSTPNHVKKSQNFGEKTSMPISRATENFFNQIFTKCSPEYHFRLPKFQPLTPCTFRDRADLVPFSGPFFEPKVLTHDYTVKNLAAHISGYRKYFFTKFSQNVHQNTIFICRSFSP